MLWHTSAISEGCDPSSFTTDVSSDDETRRCVLHSNLTSESSIMQEVCRSDSCQQSQSRRHTSKKEMTP